MITDVQLLAKKSPGALFRLLKTEDRKDSALNGQESVSSDSTSSHEALWHFKEPPVSLKEKIRFLWWSILLILSQMWRDLLDMHNGFATLFLADLLSHFFFIPVGRMTPRLVLSGPHDTMTVRVIPDRTTRRYEELESLEQFPTKQIINCASNNYGGFSRLEHDAEKLIHSAITKLPFAPGPDELEQAVQAGGACYMGFDACELAPSGFSSNILAFRTVYELARSQSKQCIFLCDKDCHNSMFTGAYNNNGATTHKFNHNDITDLEIKLRHYKARYPTALVCVAVEGIYSMEGSVAPIPSILALKTIYNFILLVDEAHSFMALGSEGRGSFNHWTDLGYPCSLTQVDIMTCMFSKSVGCTGGMVLANGQFASQLAAEGKTIATRGSERLSTAVLIRVLSVLRKPLLIRERMLQVRLKTTYAARMLAKAGCKILSSPGSPIICFPVGTVRQVAEFHKEAFVKGVAIVGGVPPATPLWGCRVRMCVFATLSWKDLDTALNIAIEICIKIGVSGVRSVSLDSTAALAVPPTNSTAVLEESKTTDMSLSEFVLDLAESCQDANPDVGGSPLVLGAGTAALRLYGIGPCSARWFYGSFDVFVSLEQRLAKLYPSLQHLHGRCRAMVCGDAEVTIGSSIAARSSAPRQRHRENLIFIAKTAPHFVTEGVNVARSSSTRKLLYYDTLQDVQMLFRKERSLHKQAACLTIYVDAVSQDGVPVDLIPLLRFIARLPKTELHSACLFLDDRNGLGKVGPRKLGFLDHMEHKHGVDFLSSELGKRASDVKVLVAGSWYNAFGHQGGYVLGAADLIEYLTWDARAYFFSTPPMPLQTAMSEKALELLQEGY